MNHSARAIQLPVILNCLLDVSCIVKSSSIAVRSAEGMLHSCSSCFCSFLSFSLPPTAIKAFFAFFFHFIFAAVIPSSSAVGPPATWISHIPLCWTKIHSMSKKLLCAEQTRVATLQPNMAIRLSCMYTYNE